MTENKRFELQVDTKGRADIIDWVESKKKNAICIYNDLGILPFSSAKALCDLLNELSEENEKLKLKVNGLKSELSIWKEDANEHIQEINKLFEENKQLKNEFNKLKHRHSLLHDVCIEAECDRDSYYKDVISLEKENEKLKQELKSFEKINFTDLCDGSRTILYMKKEKYINKENVGDENE